MTSLPIELPIDAPLPAWPDRLAGRVALVTGGASGLGAAISARLAAEGATVWVADIDEQGARSHAASLTGAQAIVLDVAKPEHWSAALDRIEQESGRIDILVNNAGITTMGSIETIDVAAFQHELDVDVIGVFLGCQTALPLMKKTGGSIVNISSASGIKADPNLVAYNAAKAAVTLMTKSIALHCAKERYGIRCNSVHPGVMRTAILEKVLAQVPDRAAMEDQFRSSNPMHQIGHPDDIAAIVAFLASDQSRYATGAAFSIDGGMTTL